MSLLARLARAERQARDVQARRRAASGPPLWRPNPGPQTMALASLADITGFGGSAGGGKSDLAIGMALTQHKDTIVFRREYPQLKGLTKRSREIIGRAGKFNGSEKIWRELPGGREIEFGAVQHDDDASKYRGRPHDLLVVDEAAEFSEGVFWFLLGWLRTTSPGQRCRALLTFNPPTDSQGEWVIRTFAPWLDRKHPNPAAPGELRWYARVAGEDVERPDGEPFTVGKEVVRPKSRTFFPSRLSDNPAWADGSYESTLQALPEPLRSQLLYGDFDAGIGADPWQVLPTAWVEAAMARWKPEKPGPMTFAGLDISHGGTDKTVLARRHGLWFAPLLKWPGSAIPDGKTAAALAARELDPGVRVNCDAIGYGASATERLRDAPPMGYGLAALAVNVAGKSNYGDRSRRLAMKNLRAELYWRLRDALDPDYGSTLALPPDRELKADLCAPTWKLTPAGVQIEEKSEIAARLGRSPDCGDAVALAMLEPRDWKMYRPG